MSHDIKKKRHRDFRECFSVSTSVLTKLFSHGGYSHDLSEYPPRKIGGCSRDCVEYPLGDKTSLNLAEMNEASVTDHDRALIITNRNYSP